MARKKSVQSTVPVPDEPVVEKEDMEVTTVDSGSAEANSERFVADLGSDEDLANPGTRTEVFLANIARLIDTLPEGEYTRLERYLKYIIQNMAMTEDVTYSGCYYRMVGSEKEWWNPPLVARSEPYRTAKRWNSEPVYVKRTHYEPTEPISIEDLSEISIGAISSTQGVTASSRVIGISAYAIIDLNGTQYPISLPYFASDLITAGICTYKTLAGTTHTIRLCCHLASGITASLVSCDYSVEYIK